jgi:hypothetical protein
MTAPIWLTNGGNLGIIPEEEYYEFVFDAYNPGGGSLTYSLVAGSLPVGLEIKSDGTLVGIPIGKVAGVPSAVSKVTTSTFSLRIKNNQNLVADRTFSLTVAGILPQIFIPANSVLGSFLDGTYVYIDINTVESNNLLNSTFSIISGSLPAGLTFDGQTGIIKGYLTPIVGDQSYQFTIKADNNITIETKNYTINVISIQTLTADTNNFTADNVSLITADILGPKHNPVILTDEGLIGTVRQNTIAEIKISALDYENDNIEFELITGQLPTGLQLDNTTGYIFGQIPTGRLGSIEYEFSIRARKVDYPEYFSTAKTFTIKVLGQIADTVEWQTNSNLGILYTGEISELAVKATVASGRVLNYKLDEEYGTLPIGLNLTQDGLISGRVSFETFMLDSNTTTFDSNTTKFDKTFTFKIAAYDVGNYSYDVKEFTIRIIDQDIEPYENLYIQALFDRDQRDRYNQIVGNSDIFPESYIYRSSDPWYGKNFSRRSLFLAGLNPDEAQVYVEAMTFNHYWKNINFGEIKTARALNDRFEIVYEVVYIDLIDQGVNDQGLGPNLAVNLPANSRNISTIYPNSFPNMSLRMEQGVGYQNKGVLPKWMTSRQDNGTILGFTRALVLCYAQPGKSAEIAYRVKLEQNQFKFLAFTIDRYIWDNSLSSAFNKNTRSFVTNNFTTATGFITGNTQSNVILGVNANITGSGTISGSSGSNTINGNASAFTVELRIGKPIYSNVGNLIGTISSIQSSSSLTLTAPLNSSINNISYISTISNTEFTQELHVNDTILTNTNVILGTVKTITSDNRLILYSNCLANVSSIEFNRSNRDPYSEPGNNDKYLKYPQVGVIS